jgi:carboxypeptidase C (cathepsin A)
VYAFLSILSTDVFPQLADRPWHITGESMAGHYVTGYTRYIASLEQDRIVRGLKPQINISSAVIVDGYVDASRQTVGYYEFFCTDWAADGRMAPLLNDTACASMAAAVPNCEFLGAQCRTSYNIENCKTSANICDETVGKYFLAGVQPGGWDPYDGRLKLSLKQTCSI